MKNDKDIADKLNEKADALRWKQHVSFDSPASVRAAINEELDALSFHDLLLALDAIRFIRTGEKLAA